jgi:hypothetical protein
MVGCKSSNLTNCRDRRSKLACHLPVGLGLRGPGNRDSLCEHLYLVKVVVKLFVLIGRESVITSSKLGTPPPPKWPFLLFIPN